MTKYPNLNEGLVDELVKKLLDIKLLTPTSNLTAVRLGLPIDEHTSLWLWKKFKSVGGATDVYSIIKPIYYGLDDCIFIIPTTKRTFVFFRTPQNKSNIMEKFFENYRHVGLEYKKRKRGDTTLFSVAVPNNPHILFHFLHKFMYKIAGAWVEKIYKELSDSKTIYYPKIVIPTNQPKDLIRNYHNLIDNYVLDYLKYIYSDKRSDDNWVKYHSLLIVTRNNKVIGGANLIADMFSRSINDLAKKENIKITSYPTSDGLTIRNDQTKISINNYKLIDMLGLYDNNLGEIVVVDSIINDVICRYENKCLPTDGWVVDESIVKDVVKRFAKELIKTIKRVKLYDFRSGTHTTKPIVKSVFMDKVFELAKELGAKIKVSKETEGDFAKLNAVAYYTPTDEEISLSTNKINTHYTTPIHELAHHIDYLLGKEHNLNTFYSYKIVKEHPEFVREAQKTLFKLGYNIYDPKHFIYPEELFAETFEIYVMFPLTLKKESPYIYKIMKEVTKELPPRTRKLIKEFSLQDVGTMEKALSSMEEKGLLNNLPYDILRIANKPVSKLSKYDKLILTKYALMKYGPKFLRDISRKAKHKARYVYTWLEKPSRKDVPGVDTPQNKQTFTKLLKHKRKQAKKIGIKI